MLPSRRRTTRAAVVTMVAALLPVIASTGGAEATGRAAVQPGPDLLATAPAPAGRPLATPTSKALRSRLVTLDTDLLPARADDQRIQFNLFDDADLTGVVESRDHGRGSTSWTGRIDGSGGLGYFDAVRVDDTYLIHVASPDGIFEISRAAGSTYRVSEVDQFEESGDDAVRDPAPVAGAEATPRPGPTSAPLGDPGDVTDVLVVYTAATLAAAGGQAGMDAQIALALTQANNAYARSGIAGRLRLVGASPTPTVEAGGNLSADLTRVTTPGDGFYDEVQALRNNVHADVVSLWISGDPFASGTCGLGYLATGEAYGFSVNYLQSCATTNYTFVHEVGHNQGADHDLTASFPPSTQVPYAHGYVDAAAKWYSMMAYATACGADCTRLLSFSNPGILEGGRTTGNEAAQNARQLNDSAPVVASWRQSQIYPGAVAITGSARYLGRLRAVAGAWAPSEVGLSFQWFVNGRAVKGATGRTFALKKRKRIGQTVSVQVTGTAATYAPVAASAPGVRIAKAAFTDSTRPKVLGKHRVGAGLTVAARSLRGWKPKPNKFAFRWFRDGKPIKGAKGRSYRITRRDRGDELVVKVIARKKSYASTGRTSKKIQIARR